MAPSVVQEPEFAWGRRWRPKGRGLSSHQSCAREPDSPGLLLLVETAEPAAAGRDVAMGALRKTPRASIPRAASARRSFLSPLWPSRQQSLPRKPAAAPSGARGPRGEQRPRARGPRARRNERLPVGPRPLRVAAWRRRTGVAAGWQSGERRQACGVWACCWLWG